MCVSEEKEFALLPKFSPESSKMASWMGGPGKRLGVVMVAVRRGEVQGLWEIPVV